jgi:hypothetical protein
MRQTPQVLLAQKKAHVVLSQKSPQNYRRNTCASETFAKAEGMTTATAPTGVQIGYARGSTGHQSLDQQLDALTAAGVDPDRIYRDKLSGTSTREQRPGLAALLDYARAGDAIVVVVIDRLGRNAAEVMATIRELRDRDIVLRSLRREPCNRVPGPRSRTHAVTALDRNRVYVTPMR